MFTGGITTELLSRIIGQDPTGRDYVHRAQMVTGTDSYGNEIDLGDMSQLSDTGEFTLREGEIPDPDYLAPAGTPTPLQTQTAQPGLVDAAAADRADAETERLIQEQYDQIIAAENRTLDNQIDHMVGTPDMPEGVTGLYPTTGERLLDVFQNPRREGEEPVEGGPGFYERVADVWRDPRREDPYSEDAASEETVTWPTGAPEGDPFTGDASLGFGTDGSVPPPVLPGTDDARGAVSSSAPRASSTNPSTMAELGIDPETGVRDDTTRATSLMERLVGAEGSDRRANTGRALMAAGASIMSTGGSLGEAIGAGINAGLITYEQARQALKEEEMAMRELQMDEEAHALEMEAAQLAIQNSRAAAARAASSGSGTSGTDGNLNDLFMTDDGRDMYGLAQDIMMLETLAADDPAAAAALARVYGDEGAYARGADAPDEPEDDWLADVTGG